MMFKVLIGALMLMGNAIAQEVPEDVIRVASVEDGACFTDMQDRQMCLAGLMVPSIKALAYENVAAPYAVQSYEALYIAIINREIFITFIGVADRWGRFPVLAWIKDDGRNEDIFLQADLLKQGHAQLLPVGPFTDEMFENLSAVELEARVKQKGLWQLKPYRPLPADVAQEGIHQTRTVTGKVLEVKITRSRTYLNFGTDYKTDFTITIPGRLQRKWEKTGFDVESLVDAEIEVMGYLTWINGPSIEVTSLRQFRNFKIVEQDAP